MSLDLASSYYTHWTEPKLGSQPMAPLTPPHGHAALGFGVGENSIWGNRKQPSSASLSWDDVLPSQYGKLTSYQTTKSIWGPPSPQGYFHAERPPSPHYSHLSPSYSYSSQLSSPPWPASAQSSAPSSPNLGSFVLPDEVSAGDYSIYNELVNAMASTYLPLCVVQFKGQRLEVFVKSQQSLAPNLVVGGHVVVDADRGRDLGLLVADSVSPEDAALVRYRQYKKQSEALHSNQAMATGDATLPVSSTSPKPIIRAARQSEIQLIDAKTSAEAKAIVLCNQKIRERGLPMTAVDAEYQWDRRKLTFYYTANQRVDFRDLIKDLFRIYKTRIWMCAVSDAAENTL